MSEPNVETSTVEGSTSTSTVEGSATNPREEGMQTFILLLKKEIKCHK